MKRNLNFVIPAFLLLLFSINVNAQNVPTIPARPGKPNTWTTAQLIQPAELASMIKNAKSQKPIIFNIGVEDDIKGAQNMGAASEKANLETLKKALTKIPKNSLVVVYCGCCPFNKCPNIRPAFQLVKDSGFKNARLLNLSTNLKTDWISKGYPMDNKK